MTASQGRSHFVRRGELRLHVLQYGDEGEDMLVLPGITSPAAVWGFVATDLAAGRRVWVLDLRGRGRSSAPPSGYSLGDYAGDAATVIEELALERPALLGHSLGARIAAALAASDRRPELGPVALADPPLSGPGRPPYPLPLEFYVDGIRHAKRGVALGELRELEPSWSDARLRDRAEWLGTCDEHAVVETYRGFHDEDFVDLWRHLDAPVLIYGSRSSVVTEAGARELGRANPSAHRIEVPRAGHMIPWDNLAGFLEAVADAEAFASPQES